MQQAEPDKSRRRPIAFLILAHADSAQLQRLVARLAPEHEVFVHWDAKSGEPPEIEGAVFTPERVSVFWGGFTMIEATMALVRTALSRRSDYLRLVLLSGSCYPIRQPRALENWFQASSEVSDLNAVRVAESSFLLPQVQRRYWRDAILPISWRRGFALAQIEGVLRKIVNVGFSLLPSRDLPCEIYHGSQWWALTPEAAIHVLDVYDTNRPLRHFFRFTFASDEKFVQTVLYNSRFAQACRAVLPETGRGTYKTANLHIIDPSLQKWFDAGDIDRIKDSERFFVRKVHSGYSDALITWIDRERLETLAD